MKVLSAIYNFIDKRENSWTWIYFHALPVIFCVWFFLTPDYTSFPALGVSLLAEKRRPTYAVRSGVLLPDRVYVL